MMSLSKHKSQQANNKALPPPQFVDAFLGRCSELTLWGQKCNSKPKIMACEVKQQQSLVLFLSRQQGNIHSVCSFALEFETYTNELKGILGHRDERV